MYLKILYRLNMKKPLNLKAPRTFNEKLQWLKLYDRKPEYTTLVDKYAVKEYIAQKIGSEYVIPTLGVWDKFEDIDFDKLPDQFVLKCTHDSGGLVICRDKSKLDIEAARQKINKSLKYNYYYRWREWPYKNVPPRIIAEKYMEDDQGASLQGFKEKASAKGNLTDYKFFCFNGQVDCVMVCLDRSSGNTKFYFFDRDWQLLRYNIRGKNAPENFTIPKPSNMEEMFAMAQKLSEGLPFVRIDLYSVSGKTFFGEMTFFPDSGFDCNLLWETDLHWGEKIDLSIIHSGEKK
ncbi:ATP-grasp fold amidoligase family protein [uncultured Fibrobacter sp.]|uniref:ATP-grasp fold amidoligase family protein n=1 Tax=uncultured Fibrobacter sp. TaxID=261512 RepID=UPI00280414C0|nr:ATP-grasp fold amidoligase family protein [uncultured Fibrobacter sp.]